MIALLFSLLDKPKKCFEQRSLFDVGNARFTHLTFAFLPLNYPEDPSAAAHVGGRSNLFGQKTQS